MSPSLHINTDITTQALWALAFAAFWTVTIEAAVKFFKPRVAACSWWPAAVPVQRKLLENFGFSDKPLPPFFPEGLDADFCCEGYCYVLVFVVSHTLCALPMVPCVFLGWDECGAVGRTAFVLGVLGDVGFDIYDWAKTTFRVWAPHTFVRLTGQRPYPTPYWVIMCVLHHPLALALAMPMNAHYVHLPAYHRIAFALLAAAAVCFGVGQWKMSLDISTRAGFHKFRAAVIVSFLTIGYTRVYTWGTEGLAALAHFSAAGDTTFHRAGLLGFVMMSIFNVALLNDASAALLKYALKAAPAPPAAPALVPSSPAHTTLPTSPSHKAALKAADCLPATPKTALRSAWKVWPKAKAA